MKKVFASLIFAWCCAFCCIAQPNGGFENWISEFSYEVPVDWQTLNVLQFVASPTPLSAFKVSGIDKHSGNYALKMRSVQVYNNPLPSVFDDTVGISFTGIINVTPTYYRVGFSYNSRPERLDFWYKYIPVGNDAGGVRVLLTKWNGVKRDTVGYVDTTLYSTPSYSLFELPIHYFSEQIPDTAAIFVGSSRNIGWARVGSTLYIDDVAFYGWVGIDENKALQLHVSAFPNPSNENITILVQNADAESLELTDVTGKNIGSYKMINNVVSIDTRMFRNGFYFYEIRNSKNGVVYKGKYSVVK